jgi:outer membrane immunogenic protein
MRAKLIGFLTASIAFSVAQSGFAADMPAKAPVYKAPMAAATPWTGFYVNGGVGYALWAADQTTLVGSGPLCSTCVTQVQGGKGWLGRIGVGYDYQFTPRIVAGVFGDFDWTSVEGTVQDGEPFRTGDIKETSAWAAGVRAGWLFSSNTLSYINGGYTGARFSSSDLVNSITGASAFASTQAFTTHGWFLGGGTEMALSPGLFWRTEYRYSYFNSKDIPEILTPTGTTIGTFTFKPTVQSVTTQLVYKFNPGGMPTPTYASIPEPATNWTGPYVNAGYGYGLWAARENSVSPVTGLCTICVTQTQGGKGWLGTIGAGYDWQFAPMWVVGVFGDYDFSSLKGTVQDHGFGLGQAISGDIKQTSAWAVGPRLGWLISPQTLTYVNGGFTSARFDGATMFNVTSTTPTGTSIQSFTTDGWFIGGGVETGFTLFGLLPKGFFFRSEYRYASYQNKTLADTGAATLASINFKPVVQTITSSIVFKLN